MSKSIESILGLNLSFLNGYHLQANLLTNNHVPKRLNDNIAKLKKIENKAMQSGGSMKVSSQSLDQTILRVKKEADGIGQRNEWSLHEIRIVSYYLSKVQDKNNAFMYALKLIDDNWRNMFFNGLVFYVLNAWNQIPQNQRNAVCNIIVKRLKAYNDTNKKYLLLKERVNFFDINGPIRVANLAIQKNMDVRQTPILLGYKESAFAQSYYSDVVIYYFKAKKQIDFDELEEILKTHNTQRTKKLIFSNLIIDAERKNSIPLQTEITRYANRILGDISKSATWSAFNNATEDEIKRLTEAKTYVNRWYARRMIEAFFEVCCQEPERKRFWLGFVDYVEDFRVVGSSIVKRMIRNDKRVSGFYYYYFIDTASTTSQTAALIMYIQDKVFVEFSDVGALYIYNKTRPIISRVKRTRFIDKVADLKIPSFPMAIDIGMYGNSYAQEGRVFHKGEWTYRMQSWMRNIMRLSKTAGNKTASFNSSSNFVLVNNNTNNNSSNSFPRHKPEWMK